MSTYAIADAIEKFARNFKEVISEKNKIEKEKLKLEKEKFEFNKQQLELNIELHNKESINKCNHNWKYESTSYSPKDMCYTQKYICTWCGETKTEEQHMITST